MRKSLLRLGALTAALTAALIVVSGGPAATPPLCAYPIAITVSGTTVTAQFSVISDPTCIPTGLPTQISLVAISYANGTATIFDSATATYNTAGVYTLSANLPCAVNSEADLVYGPPTLFPPPPYDIHAQAFNVPCTSTGTGTVGFWKNHPDAWPVPVVKLGAGNVTEAQAITILKTPPRGDATIILAYQLIAAELNVASGNASFCITSTITAANALLATYPVGSGLRTSSTAGQIAVALANTLDQYNKGLLCAPHQN